MSDSTALFRAWLVKKLTRTRWVQSRDADLQAIAERLGVTPSVLVEAQAALDAERREGGHAPAELGTRRRRSSRKIIDLEMPVTVAADWKAYCAERHLVSSVLLRSLVHTLLSGPNDPSWVGARWLYRGTFHEMTGYKSYKLRGAQWPHGAKADITHGAARALVLRASRARCNQTALLRGMAIDLLEGRLKGFQIVTMSSQMWDDESRYWIGEAP